MDKKQNLSDFFLNKNSDFSKFKIGILVSEWNEAITGSLKQGAQQTLKEYGVLPQNIITHAVPGSFELPTAAVMILEGDDTLDAVICLGCIIQGETRHFEFIAQAVATGLVQVGVDYNSPVIFGVLTCNTYQQAEDRAGGKHGNKGIEAAVSCLKMLELERKLKH
ncbi:MAG: 6,7-dimethyl-8-ribityllumazine synthase [Bacteroidales bacterium]|jgi:6,7-dimethyl-8-ribityllumazine synthase|nr:6,7-dimethyl-8-ribityllumazine synthase [Bacteroidales bacterium]